MGRYDNSLACFSYEVTMAGASVNVCLRVLKRGNRSRYDSYSVRDVPFFDSVFNLKEYLFTKCKEELSPAKDSTFTMGYYGACNKKFTISSTVQLAEALSLSKKGWITLWIDPFPVKETLTTKQSGKKRKDRSSSDEDTTEDPFDACLLRLREKHDFPEFKLRWARMLVSYSKFAGTQ
ncbi:hypothetical protein QZH41_015387 [Actinostola sp. cb2023]|nr:hypothetical protein QZH41_015387 [Actinostola sp. cb2023]